MEISAKMVSELREKTGAGMMKCKEALKECNGKMDEAVDYLRKKGLASADNKAGRTTSQGVIYAFSSDDRRVGGILELNCETDFVARNENFREFSKQLGAHILATKNITTPEEFGSTKLASGQTVDEARKGMVSKTGENMSLGRLHRYEIAAGKHGINDAYVHGEDKKLGVLVQVECGDPNAAKHDDLKAFAHEVALQIAAMKARYVTRKDVPADVINREREVVLGQIKNDPKNANKPENIMAKIVDGRINKFFEEYCLVEQVYIRDEAKTKTIQVLMDEVAKKLGTTVSIVKFQRWGVGEAAAATA